MLSCKMDGGDRHNAGDWWSVNTCLQKTVSTGRVFLAVCLKVPDIKKKSRGAGALGRLSNPKVCFIGSAVKELLCRNGPY